MSDHHTEDEARWITCMRERHARGQEYVCGLADVLRILAERDQARERERLAKMIAINMQTQRDEARAKGR